MYAVVPLVLNSMSRGAVCACFLPVSHVLHLLVICLKGTYLECQSWRDTVLGACCVVERAVRTEGELATDCHIPLVWEIVGAPERKAVRVAIITALIFCRAIEEPMVVHLFAWVVLVDIRPASINLIRRVLN